jgi:Zn-dependent alcohol dehydrogenase
MFTTKAYSAASAASPLAATSIPRRDPTPRDVQIEILFCGICHSDLHQVRNEWSSVMPSVYPVVPGHEIVGRVTKVGAAVTKYKPGDLVAVGCLVDSDGDCPNCKAGLEQLCPNQTLTFNSLDKHGTSASSHRACSVHPSCTHMGFSQRRSPVNRLGAENARPRSSRHRDRCAVSFSGTGTLIVLSLPDPSTEWPTSQVYTGFPNS